MTQSDAESLGGRISNLNKVRYGWFITFICNEKKRIVKKNVFIIRCSAGLRDDLCIYYAIIAANANVFGRQTLRLCELDN